MSKYYDDNDGGYPMEEDAAPASTQSASKSPNPNKKYDKKNDTMIPVTVKQIIDSMQENKGDKYVIDEKQVTTVRVVGKIVKKDTKPTGVHIFVDDCTGTIECSAFKQGEAANNSNLVAKHIDQDLQEGTYVTVHGYLRTFQKKPTISVYSAHAVVDFNEITYHIVECMKTRMRSKHGNLSKDAVFKKRNTNQQQQSTDTEQADANLLFSTLQEMIKVSDFSIEEVVEHLNGRLSEEFVRTTMEHWLSTAHLFSTSANRYSLGEAQ